MLDHGIGFVGAGQMARALARGFVSAGLTTGEKIVAHDPVSAAIEQFTASVEGARSVGSNKKVAELADVVFLAVKPQNITKVMSDLRGTLEDSALVVSIVAGVSISVLCEGLDTSRVIRVMPNTPCLIGEGASAYSLADNVQRADAQVVHQLLAAVGTTVQVTEQSLDAVTGLSGSGPAFVYTVIEALSDGAVKVGLPRDIAIRLAAQTVKGAAAMVCNGEDHPAVLRDRVASPGGTTIAGLQALENHGIRAALMAAVEAATQRSIELGRVSSLDSKGTGP